MSAFAVNTVLTIVFAYHTDLQLEVWSNGDDRRFSDKWLLSTRVLVKNRVHFIIKATIDSFIWIINRKMNGDEYHLLLIFIAMSEENQQLRHHRTSHTRRMNLRNIFFVYVTTTEVKVYSLKRQRQIICQKNTSYYQLFHLLNSLCAEDMLLARLETRTRCAKD